MESKDVSRLIGKEVWWEAKGFLADIISYEKGWVTIKTDDDKTHKVRAKEIVLMDSDETLTDSEGELTTVKDEKSEEIIIPEGEMMCNCGRCFMPSKLESFRCPACGRWHRVRLHPDLDKYVKGMAGTPSGRDTVDIDDDVAEMLRGMNLDELYKFVCNKLDEFDELARFSKAMNAKFRKSDITCADFLEEKYEHLNPGMQRMNLGNLLRGANKRQLLINATKEAKNGK